MDRSEVIEKVLDILEEICDDDIVKEEMDLDLMEEELLDSLGFTELLVLLEDRVGVVIAPSEVKREEMNTPNRIIKKVLERI